MRANELCPAPHLEAADLDPKADTVVTIKRVDHEIVGSEQVKKGVIWFEEYDRSMVLNRTNVKRIVAMFGNDCDSWIGKQISLYQSETDYGGQTVPCIRVREEK